MLMSCHVAIVCHNTMLLVHYIIQGVSAHSLATADICVWVFSACNRGSLTFGKVSATDTDTFVKYNWADTRWQ